jgi:DHA3 family macrolide efflux protein-like MFS transporter
MTSLAAMSTLNRGEREERRATFSLRSLRPLRLHVDERRSSSRLINRDFLLLWQAQLVSQFGNQAFTIAMTFWTATTTRSATMTGLVLMAGVLPVVVVGPFAGTLVDRSASRLRVVVTCDVVSGIAVSCFALALLVRPDALRPSLLFAVALLAGVCSAFLDPAISALVPDLVPRDQLEGANAFRQSSRQVTVLAAQGVGGILYVAVGPAMLFLIDGLSFLFAAATETFLKNPQSATPKSAFRDPQFTARITTLDGFRYVREQSGMLAFFLSIAVFNALLMPMSVLLPVYATEYLHADVQWYGFLLAAISAGAIAGCAAAGALRVVGSSRRRLLVTALAALACALIVMGQIRARSIARPIAFATGALTGTINVLTLSILQRRTVSEFRGRVLGLYGTLTRALVPVGMVAGGSIADLTGRNVPLVYAICGGLALATVLLLTLRPTARMYIASA